ncbi:MAG: response regulator, partial [Planctomycetota bacterium]
DDNYVAARTGANPGPHVMLAVSDTGCGMSAEVIERIFEPFFTTKAPGKGTGLGLWTVFGIVKHSGGHLWVYSEPGKGTTVKAYLPAVREPLALQQAVPAPAARGGSETVLVVEDESIVRRLTRRILEESGYQVLEAANGDTALQIAAEYDGCIHLMVTDVVMPDMNGLKLADALSNTRPDLRVLFVSGHPSNVLAHHGVSSADLELLEKPFGAEALLQRARELLDRDDGRPPAPNSP